MYDVIIIGAGIIGACISRELSRYKLKVLILEKEYDVAMQATMANSAIVHSGHDPKPGSLKAKFNVLGNRMYKKMSEELDIPFLDCGGVVVATCVEEVYTLCDLYSRGLLNGLSEKEIKIITRAEIKELEPNITDEVAGALYLPTTAVTYPFEVAIANIENAMDNGVELATSNEVTEINKVDDYFMIKTNSKSFESRVVINASGLNADKVSKMVANTTFKINPRRGEYYVIDKDVNLVNSVIYPTPTKLGKGVLITPQYHGNTLLGPTSEFIDLSEATKTTREGLNFIKEKVDKVISNIPYNKVIRTFAGSRPSPSTHDFIIETTNVEGFINVAGIESPGLTAAPAIGQYVVNELVSQFLKLDENDNFNPFRKKVNRIEEMTNEDRKKLYEFNHMCANIVCRCENITEGEIVDSINRNCGGISIIGIKNRVRAGSGRCQGGFCQPEVIKILARELNVNPQEILYSKENSNVLSFRTKEQYNENL